MSIITATFQQLAADLALKDLLAVNPKDQQPAIYEEWTDSDIMPYMILHFDQRQGNAVAKIDCTATLHVFSDRGSINAEAIKNRVIKVLDRQELALEEDHTARFYYESDNRVEDPDKTITHWTIFFDVKYWRKNWLLYHEGKEI